MKDWFPGTAGRLSNGDPYITIGTGEYYELPRSGGFRGICVVLYGDVDWSALVELMQDGDTVYAKRPGEIKSARIKCGGKNGYSIVSASSWSVPGEEYDEVLEYLNDIEEQAVSNGLKMTQSAASMAGMLTRKVLKERGVKLFGLRPRFRAPAHGALAGGAMATFKGFQKDSIAVDRKSAYLRAMATPLPVPGSWRNSSGLEWPMLEKRDGIVWAKVYVPESKFPNLPPLSVPVQHGYKASPVGWIEGAFVIESLRMAQELGAIVDSVGWSIICNTEPWLLPVADRIEEIGGSLSKLLYTRAWGRLAAIGGYVGTVCVDEKGVFVKWRHSKKDAEISHKVRPDYRPDAAAFVAAENSRALVRAAHALNPGSVAAVHVDCVWTNDVEAEKKCSAVDSGSYWRAKEKGDFRSFGIGMYVHGDKVACSGAKNPSKLTPDDVRAHASGSASHLKSVMIARDWGGGPLPFDPDGAFAESRAIMSDDRSRPIGEGLDGLEPDSPMWTGRGWYRKKVEIEVADP